MKPFLGRLSFLRDVPQTPKIDPALAAFIGPRTYALGLLLIVALSLSAQAFYYQPKLNTDAQVWLNIGRSLWGSDPPEYAIFYYERIYFTAFISFVVALFPPTSGGTLPVVLALSAASIALVAEVARACAGKAAALISATVFALHPIILTYGSFLVSDTLALPLSLLSLLFTAHYLRSGRFSLIVIAAVLGGFCFFVKSYTALFGILAITAYALYRPPSVSSSWVRLFALLAAFFAPIALGHLIHWAKYGDPFFYKFYYEEYAARVYGTSGLRLHDLAGAAALKVLDERADYVSQLYVKAGAFAGIWSLFAVVAAMVRPKLSLLSLLIFTAFLTLSAFLLFSPVRLSPLVFVEMQTRYLTLLLALLAVLLGTYLAANIQLFKMPLRRETAIAAGLGALSGLLVPNSTADEYFHRYRALDYYAVVEALERSSGANELLLPIRYKDMLLAELKMAKTPINFFDTQQVLGSDGSAAALKDCRCAVFIPRTQFPVLAEEVRVMELDQVSEYGPYQTVVAALQAQGFTRTPLNVPYTPLRMLGARNGVATKGALVGWVLQRAP